MAELKFQQLIPNDKKELIFHFGVYLWDYRFKTNYFRGDVIVNLTTKKFYIAPHAFEAMYSNFVEKVYDEFKEQVVPMEQEERYAFLKAECEKRISAMLLKRCEEMKTVIC